MKRLIRLLQRLSDKLFLTVQIFCILAAAAFFVATLISFRYLIGELYFFLFGQR
jgi:hypothetical protein